MEIMPGVVGAEEQLQRIKEAKKMAKSRIMLESVQWYNRKVHPK
jgi:hypothetical protein